MSEPMKLTPREVRAYTDRQIAAFLASLSHRFKGTEAAVICGDAAIRLRERRRKT